MKIYLLNKKTYFNFVEFILVEGRIARAFVVVKLSDVLIEFVGNKLSIDVDCNNGLTLKK